MEANDNHGPKIPSLKKAVSVKLVEMFGSDEKARLAFGAIGSRKVYAAVENLSAASRCLLTDNLPGLTALARYEATPSKALTVDVSSGVVVKCDAEEVSAPMSPYVKDSDDLTVAWEAAKNGDQENPTAKFAGIALKADNVAFARLLEATGTEEINDGFVFAFDDDTIPERIVCGSEALSALKARSDRWGDVVQSEEQSQVKVEGSYQGLEVIRLDDLDPKSFFILAAPEYVGAMPIGTRPWIPTDDNPPLEVPLDWPFTRGMFITGSGIRGYRLKQASE